VPEKNLSLARRYEDFLGDLKDRIRTAQIKAASPSIVSLSESESER
jgi:hypothetical protein